MKYVFVTKSQCPNVQQERAGLAGRQVMVTLQVHAGRQVMGTLQVHTGRQVMGTLQVHVVIILSVEGIIVKDMTCFCDECFSNCGTSL